MIKYSFILEIYEKEVEMFLLEFLWVLHNLEYYVK